MTISTVTIVGAGYMGGGIAQVLAIAGLDVTLADVSVETANASLERLRNEAREFEAQGLFAPGSADLVEKNISAGRTIEEAVADVDLVEEAVFERLDVKRQVLGLISEHARPDTIIGTNTSTIPVKELESAVKHPERFLTVHFSNPAPFIPGVELVAGEATTPETVAAVKELLERSGNQGAQVADTPGMVLNRLQYVLLKEAMSIVEEGVATKEDVDTIVRTTFGFRLGFFGPFAIADQAGLDVYVNCFETFENAFGERLATPQLLKDAVAADRKGVKNGAGLLGTYDEATSAELVAYRNNAYARMSQLLAELGPAPKAS
ncbi:3-hydroxyacyl-CoA dehydrogenase family protein [Brachybacterium horti]